MKSSNYKIREITFFICMGIFSLVYQVSASIEPNEEEAILFAEEFTESMNQMDSFGIFIHNTTITLPMFIPGAGFVWGLYSSWETGFAFASLVSITPGLYPRSASRFCTSRMVARSRYTGTEGVKVFVGLITEDAEPDCDGT